MTLMEQCRIWKEEKNYQKMISALEALSAGERTPELDRRSWRRRTAAARIRRTESCSRRL